MRGIVVPLWDDRREVGRRAEGSSRSSRVAMAGERRAVAVAIASCRERRAGRERRAAVVVAAAGRCRPGSVRCCCATVGLGRDVQRVGGWGVAVAFLRRFARGTKLVAVADRQGETMSERQIHDQRILARFHERLTVEKWYKKAVSYIQ